jgi:hypothetical protein
VFKTCSDLICSFVFSLDQKAKSDSACPSKCWDPESYVRVLIMSSKKDPENIDKALLPFPLRRRWNANIILGVGGYDDYVDAVGQPGEAPDDLRMPNETKDGIGGGAVKIKRWKDRPEDGEWCKSPLFPQTQRVQSHEFVNELRHPVTPLLVDMQAYLLAPISIALRDRIMLHEQLFRKAGIPARHLQFLPDLWASERLPWERTRHGWYGTVSNLAYQAIIDQRNFDRYGGQWYGPGWFEGPIDR